MKIGAEDISINAYSTIGMALFIPRPLGDPESRAHFATASLAHVNLTAVLRKDDLDADVRVIMDAAVLETGETSGDNPLTKALEAVLADVSKFSANAKLAGPLDNVSIKMTSDLDNVLKDAVGKQIKNLTNEFRDALQAGVLNKVEGPMADMADSMSAVDSIAREIRSRLDIGNEVSSKLLF